MYYLQDRVTGQPVDMGNMGRVRRVYGLRLLAQRDAQAVKERKVVGVSRVDVVELSHSARLWLENQRRFN
ncbi:MAG: hypothetical protein CL512_04825 [Actinobacteria bacterium]|nr:hypothetical protein [Actinomycetota bacterium]